MLGSERLNGPTEIVIAPNGDIWVKDGRSGPQTGLNKDKHVWFPGGQ